MNARQRILVVDDTPHNVKLLADILTVKGYEVITASSGAEALQQVESASPDLVLLDVVMPEMSGYDVCRKIRENERHGILPIVMITALDPSEERIKGLDVGADDFLTKPINQPELLARVRSLLRVKELYTTVQRQSIELAEWNHRLEDRVKEQLEQLEKLNQLKRFFSPSVAELIVAGGAEDPLKSHRREVSVAFVDLRGFTAFADSSEPEEVMNVLREYHAVLGKIIVARDATVEHFAGDGIMILFNDPVIVENPAYQAVSMAIEMHEQFKKLAFAWAKRGYDIALGIGIAHGYATIGAVGFEGRLAYGTVGSVANLAARLSSEAKGGQTLISKKALALVEEVIEYEFIGDLTLKGFLRPVPAYGVIGAAGKQAG